MIKTLTKHGNSYALVIDKAILELLKFDPEQPLEITTDGEALTVRRVTDTRRARKLARSLAKINRRHGAALKKLAE